MVTAGPGSTISLGNGNDTVTAGSGSTISLGNGNDTVTAGSGSTISMPTLTTLASFNGTDVEHPVAGLIADAAGDLFGTTIEGGTNGDGTVCELVNNGGGNYSPTTLASFNGTNGDDPVGGLIADAAGDLFGTTYSGGATGDGTVFELVNNGGGYASTPTTVASFNGGNGQYPHASLIADAAGDLFGTTFEGGANNDGTVFEIAKTGSSYASTPTTLVNFIGTNGAFPEDSLIADAAGDLFGTTAEGGAYGANVGGYGTVFEIAKTGTGYASTPTTLASFNGGNGQYPYASLIADAAGDLFGTTFEGGRTALMARCSRSPRPAAATPARRPHWPASTSPTGNSRAPV